MRRSFRFWWRCIQEALRGNSAFANDWQWVFGNPAATVLSALVAATFGVTAVTTNSSVLDALVLAALAFVITWFVAFVLRLFGLPGKFYHAEKDRADAAERRLAPKIEIFLDASCKGVRRVQTEHTWSKWVQIMVRSATDAPLIDCEARVTSVERVSQESPAEAILDEPIFATWGNVPQDQFIKMNIPAGIAQPANLFCAYQGGHAIFLQAWPEKIQLGREIQKIGKYRLKITVSAKDVTSINKAYVVSWGGSYDDIQIENEETAYEKKAA